MSALSPERWRAVSPFLDQALDLAAQERAVWLAQLSASDPALAADLEALLDEHRALSERGFLEHSPATLLEGAPGAGQVVGTYTLESAIGEGGMGTVWLARRSDGRFERHVAVKFPGVALLGDTGRARFRREGTVLGRLTHPHIAGLLDAGLTATGRPFLVLEHVDGEPIDRHCDRKRLDVRSRVRLFLDVLSAVAHAHAHLVVHRDIKPSNVLVTDDGRVKLLDFGIAKLLVEPGEASPLTRDGASAMTPAYAAPEQLTGHPVTTATDVYALGVLLYALLSGRHPAGPGPYSPAQLVKAVVESEPIGLADAAVAKSTAEAAAISADRAVTPPRLRHLLRGDLDTIVAKALKKDPRHRYPSVTAFADDLRRYLAHLPIGARPDRATYRAARFVRRHRAAVGIAAVAFVALAAAVVGIVVQAQRARGERDFALAQLARAEAQNDLDQFLLSDAAPSGRPFTVNDLLARAEHMLERQQGRDADRVELLVSVGRQYHVQDEDESARRVLERAYRLSRGLADPAVRAKASCALASALAPGADLGRAEPLFAQGLAELPETAPFAIARVFCLLRGSEVARGSGRPQEAIARVEAARSVLRSSPSGSPLLDVRILMDLAESYREAGRFPEAVQVFEQASAGLTALGRDDTQTAGTLFNNWALTLDLLGRPLDAEPIYRRAIEIGRDDRGEEAVSPMLLKNYARNLQSLERLDAAADYAERAHVKALRTADEGVVVQSLFELERIHRKQGDLGRSAEVLAELAPRIERVFPPGHPAFAALASDRSLLAQARGELRRALELADEAVVLIEASIAAGGAGAEFLPTLLVRRADVQLLLGRSDATLADARRAVEALREATEPGILSCNLGRAYLALGRGLLARGERREARAALESATRHLADALGADHPEARAAVALSESAGDSD